MRLKLLISEIPYLKTALKKFQPELKATARIERFAREVGFKSYAALRAEMKKNLSVAFESLSEANKKVILLAKVLCVMEVEPRLTTRGFDGPWEHRREDYKKSKEQLKFEFQDRRNELIQSIDEFELALIYLSMQGIRKTINKHFSSYSLKHRAEDISRKYGMFTELGNYVSNGVFITAAIAMGIPYKRVDPFSQNALFALSSKSIRRTAGEPLLTRSEKASLFESAIASVML